LASAPVVSVLSPASFIGNEWTCYDSNRWGFVPAGILTDLGSVPPILRPVINHAGAGSQPFVLHDQLCEYLSITVNGRPFAISRGEADLILRAALIDVNVEMSEVRAIYDAVSIYARVMRIRDPSTYALKRRLEAEYNFEDFE